MHQYYIWTIIIYGSVTVSSVIAGSTWQTSIEPSGYVLRRIEFILKGVLCWAMGHFEAKTAAYSVPVYSLAPHHSALVARGSHGTIRQLIPPNSGAESKNQAFSFSQSICRLLQAEVQHLSSSSPTGFDRGVLCHHYWIPTVTPLVAQSSNQTCWNSAAAQDKAIHVMWWHWQTDRSFKERVHLKIILFSFVHPHVILNLFWLFFLPLKIFVFIHTLKVNGIQCCFVPK